MSTVDAPSGSDGWAVCNAGTFKTSPPVWHRIGCDPRRAHGGDVAPSPKPQAGLTRWRGCQRSAPIAATGNASRPSLHPVVLLARAGHGLRSEAHGRIEEVRREQGEADPEGVSGHHLSEGVHTEHEPIETDDECHQHTDH